MPQIHLLDGAIDPANPLRTIADSSALFLEARNEKSLLQLCGTQIRKLTPDNMVCIASFDESSQKTTILSLCGDEESQELLKGVFGFDPVGAPLPLSANEVLHQRAGKIIRIERIYNPIAQTYAADEPQAASLSIQDVDLYAIGIGYQDRLMGSVVLISRRGKTICNPEAIETLTSLASMALHRIRTEQALARQNDLIQRRFKESQALAEISRALLGTLDFKQALQLIVEAAHRIVPNVERAVIHLLDESGDGLIPVAITGMEVIDDSIIHFRTGQGIAGAVILNGETINLGNTLQDERFAKIGNYTTFNSLLVAPVLSGEKPIGTVSVHSAKFNAFSSDDEHLMTILGVQAGLAIANSRLYSNLEKALHQEKSLRAQLLHSEKLTAIGRLIATIAHELNNPLQAIKNSLYLIKTEGNLGGQALDDIEVVITETNRMADLVARLREIYRPVTDREAVLTPLQSIIEEVRKILASHMRQKRVNFEFLPDEDIAPALVIPDQIKQVFLNICVNAIEAMPGGGYLKVRMQDDSSDRGVITTFEDNGRGMDPETRTHIFEPFFTTKGGGTGLGLAISLDIVERHKGKIEILLPSGTSGTAVKVWLPTVETTSGGKPVS